MVKLINNTNKCIRCVSRINGRWFDGILPGDTLFCDDPYKTTALLKHGCSIVPKPKKVKKKIKSVVSGKKEGKK